MATILETADHQPVNIDSDVETLQEILTRYVDSRDGYLQASTLVPDEGLSRTFTNIATRRESLIGRVAELVQAEGQRPDVEGSPEASIHRWWIRLRDKVAARETSAIVAECLRGEKELARTLRSALEVGSLSPAHHALITDTLSEVDLAVSSFEVLASET